MIIRKATSGDIETLSKLLWEFNRESWAVFKNPLHKPKPKKEFMKVALAILKKQMKNRRYFTFLALEKGHAIGFVSSEVEHNKHVLYIIDKRVYVKWLFVTRNCRRKRVATNLMNAVFEEAKKRKIKAIRLGTSVKNRKGISFYTKFGFKKQYHTLEKVLK